MNKSNVYYCDLHTGFNMNLLQKLKKLMLAAGIKNIDFQDKFAAIKIHFGEPGNLAYLRPNYAKAVSYTHLDVYKRQQQVHVLCGKGS